MKQIIAGVAITLAMASGYAATPLWTFTPLTPTTITVPINSSATVSYQVTNQSKKTHTLMMQAIAGVTQVTTAGHCPTPFVLASQQSCILRLAIDGSALRGNVFNGPAVCEQGNPNQCYQPSNANSLHITQEAAVNYTVGGSVVGLIGALVLENNGGDTLTLNADGSFTFASALPPGSIYVVTIQSQPATQTCTLINNSGTVSNANINNINVYCSVNTRTIGGTVTGLSPSESVVLLNNGGDTLTVSGSEPFTFSSVVAQGAPYNVTVSTKPNAKTCTVSRGNGIVGSTDITNVQVTCATNAYTLGGTVSGLSGTVVLQNNLDDTLSRSDNGEFTFSKAVAQGAPYEVTVLHQPLIQTCTVSNFWGSMGSSNVTNVGVDCVTNNTSLESSVSNLALSVSGLTEYGIDNSRQSGLARTITIKNTGTNPTINLSVTSPTWPAGTSSTNTCAGATLAPNGTCTITITPGPTATSDGSNPCSTGTTPVAGIVQVSAANASTVSIPVVVLNYGCIYQGGYIYAFDDTKAADTSVGGKVMTTADRLSTNNTVWASNGVNGTRNTGQIDRQATSEDSIPGIDEVSTSLIGSPTYNTFANYYTSRYTGDNPFTAADYALCDGLLDGSCNSANINKFYQTLTTHNKSAEGRPAPFTPELKPTDAGYYAAGLCIQEIASYSDWYLPAICEMGYREDVCGTASAPKLQNMQSNLVDFNNLNLVTGQYWSSTLLSLLSQTSAWRQVFANNGTTTQSDNIKSVLLGVRCSRAF